MSGDLRSSRSERFRSSLLAHASVRYQASHRSDTFLDCHESGVKVPRNSSWASSAPTPLDGGSRSFWGRVGQRCPPLPMGMAGPGMACSASCPVCVCSDRSDCHPLASDEDCKRGDEHRIGACQSVVRFPCLRPPLSGSASSLAYPPVLRISVSMSTEQSQVGRPTRTQGADCSVVT